MCIYICTAASKHHQTSKETYTTCHDEVTKQPSEGSDLESNKRQFRAYQTDHFSNHLHWISLAGPKTMQQQDRRASHLDRAIYYQKLSKPKSSYQLNPAYVARACKSYSLSALSPGLSTGAF